MAIRWRKSDIAELRNYVRKFNAKITRAVKKNPAAREFLPERLSVKEIQERITERKDYNNLKKSINRFMKKGAENLVTMANGIVVTQYQKKELEIQRQIVNRKRAQARKEAGELQPGRMGKIEHWAYKALGLPEMTQAEQWGKYVETLEKQSKEAYYVQRDEQYLANWLQGLFTQFGDEWAKEIIDATSVLDRSKLINAIIKNDALSLGFVYDLTELEAKKQRLLDEIALLY